MEFILPAIFVGRKLGLKGQELAVGSLGRRGVDRSRDRAIPWIAADPAQGAIHRTLASLIQSGTFVRGAK